MPLLPFGAKPPTNKPTEPRLKAMSNSLYSIPGWQVYSVTTKSYGVGAGDTIFVPIYIGGKLSFNGLAINVTTAGDPNQPVRLGVYNSRTVGNYILPGTVAVDAGTVSVGTTGIKTASVNLTLDKGYYFTVISISTGSTTGLGLRTVNVASKTPVGGVHRINIFGQLLYLLSCSRSRSR